MRNLDRLLFTSLGIAMTGFVLYTSAVSAADLCVIGVQATETVSSANALQAALSQAGPGTTIIVREGSYNGDFTLSKSGNAAKPITIRADGQVVFTDGIFTLKGSYAILMGMSFDNGMVTVLGNYNRVTRNVFKNGKPGGNESKLHSAVHTAGPAQYNRIDHNEVVKWQRRAIRNTELESGTKGNRFDHNYLHDLKGVWGNAGEAFQVGTGPNHVRYSPETIIEYNLVDGHALESEIVSLKSNGNIVQGNTFANSPKGTIQTRTGARNKLLNNTMINIREMSIYSDNNEVIGNKFIDSNLTIRSGDAQFSELLVTEKDGKSKYAGSHPAARNTLVVGNEFFGGNISLGKKGSGKVEFDRAFPTEHTVLALNKGAKVVVEGAVQGTQSLSAYHADIGKPIQIALTEVGPKAADPICDEREWHSVLLPPQNLKVLMAKP
jgi:hypothetical protein